jgi:hypothetical protein
VQVLSTIHLLGDEHIFFKLASTTVLGGDGKPLANATPGVHSTFNGKKEESLVSIVTAGFEPEHLCHNVGVEIHFNAPDKFGISRIDIQFWVFTEIPTSWPDRLHVTTLAFEMAWSRLLREVCVKPTGLPTCLACQSLPKSAGQAPNYAQILPAGMWFDNGAECVF